jgi:hypothetical protein
MRSPCPYRDLPKAWITGLLLLVSGPLLLSAQSQLASTFDPQARFAWSANAGWINFNQAGSGVAVYEYFLGGWAWSQTTGWLHLGSGLPEDGIAYGNDAPDDYGVNVLPGGRLAGFAWSPSTGWIHFEQTEGVPRIDLRNGQFSGFAWSPNLGWINLGSDFQSVPDGPLTTLSIGPLDSDADGLGDGWERRHFGSLTASDGSGDSDLDGFDDADEYRADTDPLDLRDFLRLVDADVYNPQPNGTDNVVSLQWTSSDRRLYRIMGSTDLSATDPFPTTLLDEIQGSIGQDQTSRALLQELDGSNEFWRIEVESPLANP